MKNQIPGNTEKSVQFLQLVVGGKIDEAYETFVDMKGKHHNPYFPAGFPALKEAMKDDYRQSPRKIFRIQHTIENNQMVAVHSYLETAEFKMTVVHLFRFENEKIVEMWDVAQVLPSENPNADGAI